MTDNFQSKSIQNHTKQKLLLLEEYLNAYIEIISRSFNSLCIVDAYAGCGKYGNNEKGSPVIISEALKKIVFRKDKKAKNIEFWANDFNEEHYSSLKKELNKFYFAKISNKDGKIFINDYIEYANNNKIDTSLFFVDPYNYSFLKEDIDNIFNSCRSYCCEVLLFIPLSHIHRFVKIKNKCQPIYNFLKSYNIDRELDINNFANSIKYAFEEEHNRYCAYMLFEENSNKYALFFITKNIYGADKFLEAKERIKIDKIGGLWACFPEVYATADKDYNIIANILKSRKMNNIELYEFAIKNNISKQYLSRLVKNSCDKIKIGSIEDLSKKPRGLYIDYENYKKGVAKTVFWIEN